MDSTYMEEGVEVIIWKPYPHKESFKGHRGTITTLTRCYDGRMCCYINGQAFFVWFPEELILASDEPLLR